MPPTEFTEFTETNGARYSPTDFTDVHRLGGYGIPAIPTQPTKLSSHRSFWQRRASHRIHRIHRIFWRKIFSHGFHGYTQIRRVWHPCHTHAAHQTIFPQKPQNLTQPNHLWTSVKSVGEYSPTVVSVGSANSVGGYARFAWLVHLRQVHPLGGWRGYGRMPYPPTKTPTDCTDVHRLGGKNAT